MRTTRLYHPEKLSCGKIVTLDANNSGHLIRVLRTQPGSEVVLFDGSGYDFHCTTIDADPKKTHLDVLSSERVVNESNLSSTLIQGISRNDRMDASIQKAVELGINKIIPLLCERSNYRVSSDRTNKKHEHWNKIVISACEQSGRSSIPQITDITPLSDIDQVVDSDALKILLNPRSKTTLNDISCSQKSVEIIVGPEGGLSYAEIQTLESKQFCSVRFGPRILRTETTGPAVLSAVQVLWGDM